MLFPGLVLALLLSTAGFPQLVDSEGVAPRVTPAFTVYFCDQTELTPSTVRLIEHEVRHPFAWADLNLVWRAGCPNQPHGGDRPTGARIYVLHELLDPLLRMPGFACRDAQRVLGIVLTRKGDVPSEVVYVSRGAVEDAIEQEDIAPSVPVRARALGRVITHELAHRFLAKTDHSLPGILRGGAIRPRALTEPSRTRFRFSRSEVQLLEAVLTPDEPGRNDQWVRRSRMLWTVDAEP